MNQHEAMSALSRLATELGYPKTSRLLKFLAVVWLDKVYPYVSAPDYDRYMTPVDGVELEISATGLWTVFSDTFSVEMTESTVGALITKEKETY